MTPNGGLTTDDYVILGYQDFMRLFTLDPQDRIVEFQRLTAGGKAKVFIPGTAGDPNGLTARRRLLGDVVTAQERTEQARAVRSSRDTEAETIAREALAHYDAGYGWPRGASVTAEIVRALLDRPSW